MFLSKMSVNKISLVALFSISITLSSALAQQNEMRFQTQSGNLSIAHSGVVGATGDSTGNEVVEPENPTGPDYVERPTPSLGTISILESTFVHNNTDIEDISRILLDGEKTEVTHLRGISGNMIEFELSHPSKVIFSSKKVNTSTNASLQIVSLGDSVVRKYDGTHIFTNSLGTKGATTTSDTDIIFNYLPAGQYAIKSLFTSSAYQAYISEITAQVPDLLTANEGEFNQDIIINNVANQNGHFAYGSGIDLVDGGTINTTYGTGNILGGNDVIEFSLLKDSVVEMYVDHLGSADGVDQFYLDTIDGGAFIDADGVDIKRDKLLFDPSSDGWISTTITIPAGDYRIYSTGTTTSYRVRITEIRALEQTDPSYDYQIPAEQISLNVTDYLVNNGNAQYGRYDAWTDGLTGSTLHLYDTGLIYGGADFIEVNLSAPAVVEMYVDHTDSADGVDQFYLDTIDGGAFIDADGVDIKRDKIRLDPSSDGWVSTIITIPAGDYKIYSVGSNTTYRVRINEIRALVQTDPSYDYQIPAGRVKVEVTDYQTNNGNPLYGRYDAWTDGLNSTLHPYDTGIIYGGNDFITFTIAEDAYLEMYISHIGSADNVDQFYVSSVSNSISQIYVNPTSSGFVRVDQLLPAGEYRIDSLGVNTGYRVTINEIRAFQP